MQDHETIQRRQFLGSAAATAASASLWGAGLALAADAPSEWNSNRKIKVGIVGCGGRGSWIAGLFHHCFRWNHYHCQPGDQYHGRGEYYRDQPVEQHHQHRIALGTMGLRVRSLCQGI